MQIENIDDYFAKVAKSEITRLLKLLGASQCDPEKLFAIYKNPCLVFKPQSSYHDPEIIVPLLVYLHLRISNVIIGSNHLIENSGLNRHLFRKFVFQILEYAIYDDTEVNPDLTINILESDTEKEKFQEFVRFIQFYEKCPICMKTHNKEYVISYYFNSKKRLKRKLLYYLRQSLLSQNKQNEHYSKNLKINFAIPCKMCIAEF